MQIAHRRHETLTSKPKKKKSLEKTQKNNIILGSGASLIVGLLQIKKKPVGVFPLTFLQYSQGFVETSCSW